MVILDYGPTSVYILNVGLSRVGGLSHEDKWPNEAPMEISGEIACHYEITSFIQGSQYEYTEGNIKYICLRNKDIE